MNTVRVHVNVCVDWDLNAFQHKRLILCADENEYMEHVEKDRDGRDGKLINHPTECSSFFACLFL